MPLRFVYIAYFALLFCNVPHHNIILQYQCYHPIIDPLTNALYRSIIMLHMRTVWDRQGWCTTLKLPRNEVSYTKVHLTSVYHMSILLLLQFNVYCYIID